MESRRWTDGGQNEIVAGGTERDNDDETSAGPNGATGWVEVKLIGLRELWRVKRGRERETDRRDGQQMGALL